MCPSATCTSSFGCQTLPSDSRSTKNRWLSYASKLLPTRTDGDGVYYPVHCSHDIASCALWSLQLAARLAPARSYWESSLAPARSYFRCNLSPARSCHCTTQVPTSAELHHHVAVLMRNLGEADALALYHQSLVLEPAFIISLTVPTHPTHPPNPPTFACPLEHMDASTHTPNMKTP